MDVVIRVAREEDAEEACEVVRASIETLCVADHENDERELAIWLGNKNGEWFQRSIALELPSSVVAVRGGRICGFGQMNHTGEIVLLYVPSEARFTGASISILEWLEREAVAVGKESVHLSSTLTAKRFYEARGYRQVGEAGIGFTTKKTWPMVKHLVL